MTANRRSDTVTLPQGNYHAELADLKDRATAAFIDEQAGVAPKRASTRSQATKLAQQYDALAKEAEASAAKVTVWAIHHNEWSELADEHLPREGEDRDAIYGVNMKTFPPALLAVALIDPAEDLKVPAKLIKGNEILEGMDLAQLHYAKLERAAWNVNVGDDALPKSSLVSLLQEAREQGSLPPNDSE